MTALRLMACAAFVYVIVITPRLRRQQRHLIARVERWAAEVPDDEVAAMGRAIIRRQRRTIRFGYANAAMCWAFLALNVALIVRSWT